MIIKPICAMQEKSILALCFVLSLCVCLFTSNLAAREAEKKQVDQKLLYLLKEAASQPITFADKFDAQVWLLDMSTRLEPWFETQSERIQFLKSVYFESIKANLKPELVLSVIQVESNFDRFAISSAGARGLMQIMPFWLKEIGRPDDNLFNVQTNLRFGCTILRYYLDMEKGNLSRALGRYNGSLGRYKYPNKVFRAMDKNWYVN